MLTIYLDVFFLRYLILEVFSLLFLQIWFHVRLAKWKNVCIPVVIAGLGTLFLFVLGYGSVFVLCELLIHVVGIAICFGGHTQERFLWVALAKFIFLFGLTGIFLWLQSYHMKFDWFALGTVIAAVVLLLLFLMERRHTRIDRKLRSVTLYYKDRCVSLMALYDSGNLLRDPYVGQPVSVVDTEIFGQLQLLPECGRWIEYSSIGEEKGYMHVWTIDKMEVDTRMIEHPVIGIAPRGFLRKDRVHMLLSADLF